MTIFALTSILVGAVFGLRFKVLILFPAIVIGFVATVAAALVRGDDVWSIALTMVLVATGLQIGYLGGMVTRFVIAAARVSRHRTAGAAVSATPRGVRGSL